MLVHAFTDACSCFYFILPGLL